ncbi:MAG: hypothetical protein OEM27_04740 [Nitrospinota bacterium]|nr:hypothetical protein [Nitrospinota bacterium]
MNFGDPSIWTIRFRSIDQRLLERIAYIWSKCLSVLPVQPDEDMITRNLVNFLWKDSETRKLGWPDYQYVPFSELPKGNVAEKGYVDIGFILDQDRDRYIAYECKRLNVQYKGSRQSLATPYVKEGMMRYVSEQYSEKLPFACMLGYVIDGDIPFAKKQVWKAIGMKKLELRLLGGPNSADKIASLERFITDHQRSSGNPIEIRHAFLPFEAVV